MTTPRKALLVTPDLDRAGLWSGWLRRAGYVSLCCVGPALSHDCPRLRAADCPLRQAVSFAVVDVDSDLSAARCTTLPDDGTTISIRVDGSMRDQRARLLERVGSRELATGSTSRPKPASDLAWELPSEDHGDPRRAPGTLGERVSRTSTAHPPSRGVIAAMIEPAST